MKKLSLVLLLAISGCFGNEQNEFYPNPISISGTSVQISADSKFLEQLQIVALKAAPGGEKKLRTVGQMIAMANASGALTRDETSWVTLDTALIHSLGLFLSSAAPVGLAYGVTSLGDSYHSEVHVGERVEIYRYGLKQNSTQGSVISVKKAEGSLDEYLAIFAVSHGRDWYPGTNCQVEFPLIQKTAVALSPLSMLHEGKREYVMKEIAPGRYEPKEITVVNETRDQVFALGDLIPGDKVVERGAILLKPTIHQILVEAKEVSRVR